MARQPARGQQSGDRGGEDGGGDDGDAGGAEGAPVLGERAAGDGGVGRGQEAVEHGVLEEGETDGGGGGAEGEDEAEVPGFGLEGGHCMVLRLLDWRFAKYRDCVVATRKKVGCSEMD